MAYTLKSSEVQFRGGKNILASEHVQYIHGGATFDATKFPAGYIELGQLVARNQETGKFEPFSTVDGFDTFSIYNEDHDNTTQDDFIAGAVIIEGSVYTKKLPVEVPAEFKEANPNIHYVEHIKGL